MSGNLQDCDIPAELIRFELPLVNVATQFDRKKLVKIVAIGSSSTEGDGASSQAFAYPSRLEAALRLRLPDQSITVFNKGARAVRKLRTNYYALTVMFSRKRRRS